MTTTTDQAAELITRCEITFGRPLIAGFRRHIDTADPNMLARYRAAIVGAYQQRGGTHTEGTGLVDALERAIRYQIVCTCCGGRHGRQVVDGEHCGWCERRSTHPAVAPEMCGLCATGHGTHHPDCPRA